MTRVFNLDKTPRTSNAVYIGRPSKWGNPFHIGKSFTRAEAIEAYEDWITAQPQLLGALHELKGKDLFCWCAPRPCHGDVLARLAEECA